MKLFKSPRALIHYSHAEIDVFDRPQGQFKVQTQGRLYTLNFDKSFMSKLGVTKAIKPRSALLFTDAALEKFTPHPILGLHFFKRLFGQHWSREFGDVVWDRRDTVCEGNVLRIKDVRIIPIEGGVRRWWQRIKVATVVTVDLALLGFVLAVLALTYFQAALGTEHWLVVLAERFEQAGKWFVAKAPLIVGCLTVWGIAAFFNVKRTMSSQSFEEDFRALGFEPGSPQR
ncbi:hypothetical protein JYG34_13225 [Pseudomonas entomophila]|uniref:hypothetical protein n=1 Tax=Pseudomonas entomophila TaxID=312306 RepID=UPI001BCBADBA|nr:hypothetical protein [Pseudomonas entomophila]QVM93903.1 hypothetical protein JYG34_13225 [Pseudomonas entomophila]